MEDVPPGIHIGGAMDESGVGGIDPRRRDGGSWKFGPTLKPFCTHSRRVVQPPASTANPPRTASARRDPARTSRTLDLSHLFRNDAAHNKGEQKNQAEPPWRSAAE
jgi:hypothetical protein